ncbi:MAG: alanine dehydrogenase [Cyclobacteriaceae bacterium]|jgi:alanine dehydrogenase|nr:alanine dehydrogenase [Cyclobacteriaceae bacterium]MDH4294995.1 alanine dehydrogenase [Cyclobacteriaceae bacterium]MDH5247624.1 alanine dehydrogenase [Cyclobacteriaceae bacterium]
MTEKKKTGFEALAKASLHPQEQLLEVRKRRHAFFIGLPKEISLQENRISLTPDAVGLLVHNGHDVWVETKAGNGSKFSDKQYSDAGAKIVYSPQEVYQADVILKIEPPTLEEIDLMHAGQTLISALQLGHLKVENLQAMLKKKITSLAYEFIEDKVGGMPIVRAMSEIAGSTVMLIASEYLSTANNGKGVILGGITGVPPTKVVVIGAGTVAEYAVRCSLGLGADVQVFDNHIYKLRRIKHLLGQQIYTSTIDTITLSEALKAADVVVGALRAEKGRARHVITEEMVMQMKTDSLIIDLSIDQGGCVETSDITTLSKPVFRKHGVIHYCVPNVASRVAHTASTALSNIFTPTILRAAEDGGVEAMIFSHKWFMKGVYTYKGGLTNEYVARKFGIKHKNIELLMAARF